MTASPIKTLVISPVGEPGSGKSTFAFGLVHALKQRGIRAEFVPEIMKYESYTPEAIAKVMTGRFEARLLRRQHALAKPLFGQVEVLVNDGCLPAFFYYTLLRTTPAQQGPLRALYERLMAEQQPAEHRYVTLEKPLAYDHHGRRETEAQSRSMRQHLLTTLATELGATAQVLRTAAEEAAYIEGVVHEAFTRRALASMG